MYFKDIPTSLVWCVFCDESTTVGRDESITVRRENLATMALEYNLRCSIFLIRWNIL